MTKEKVIAKWEKVKEGYIKLFNLEFCLYMVIAISLVCIILGICLQKPNIGLIAITIILIYNLCYGLANLRERFLFVLFNIMMFTFIIDRPMINAFRGVKWWNDFSITTIMKSLSAIYLTEFCLLLGSVLSKKLQQQKNKKNKEKIHKSKMLYVGTILIILIIVTGITNAYMEISKYISMRNVDYSIIYTSNTKRFPVIIRTLGDLFQYTVFAYLATMPNKKKSMWVLAIFCLLGMPSFLLGVRNIIVLRFVFTVVYIMIREFYFSGGEKWIKRQTKVISIILVPIMLITLGAYNYIRDDEKVITKSPIKLIVDFFYKQGTSFDTVCQGFENEKEIKDLGKTINYTFGDIIDYVIHNSISQKIFGTIDLGSGNNINMVKYSNSMAHKLSYVVMGEKVYLAGHGRGTSFIIETYMDAGFWGIAIYSMVISIFLSNIVNLMKKENFIITYIILTAIFNIFLLPRYSASGFITFIVTPQFWSIPVFINIISWIINQKERRSSGR